MREIKFRAVLATFTSIAIYFTITKLTEEVK